MSEVGVFTSKMSKTYKIGDVLLVCLGGELSGQLKEVTVADISPNGEAFLGNDDIWYRSSYIEDHIAKKVG